MAVPDGSRTSMHARFHWVWIVVLAIATGCLTVVLAQAQQKATDAATFRKLVDDYCAAWSTANADAPAKYYAKDADLVFYDIAPFAYRGWKEYHDGVQKQFFQDMAEGKITAGKDLKVTRRGLLAWTTVSMHFSETTKDGKKTETELRYTGIWEKRGGKWLIVHEHISVPMS